ncbi:unnamed protein product [Linum trigynum]|uniref:CCHC-type domain-containing protein n=1 Tax=Linum trigynum TaxID=586398 RepID=A0AAV2FF72_9ROSI
MGSVVTHEDKLRREESEEPRKEKQSIAFKVSEHEEEFDSLDDMEDDELAMLSKHVAKLLRLRKERRRNINGRAKEADSDKDQFRQSKQNSRFRKELAEKNTSQEGCFKCGRNGHIKVDCPQIKKDKAHAATWSCSEDEDEDGESGRRQ